MRYIKDAHRELLCCRNWSFENLRKILDNYIKIWCRDADKIYRVYYNSMKGQVFIMAAIDKISASNSNFKTAPTPKKVEKPAADTAKAVNAKAQKTKAKTNAIREEINENTEDVKNAIAKVNQKMNNKTRCEFSYHEDTKRVSIKVIDVETEEVIREIPPEETLNMLTKMWDIAGILIDEQR